jgi:glycosyltransferase involved in cell wall biosynthesis
MQRILIVDSGMRTLGGHNFTYTEAVRSAFVDRGHGVQVFVNRGLPADLAEAHGFRPVFSVGNYDAALGHGWVRDLAYVYAQSIVFAEDLEHAFRSLSPEVPDLIFSHTLADFELLGWRRFLGRRHFAGRLAIVVRQTPGYATCGWLRRTLHPYWRLRPRALNRLRGQLGSGFMVCTDSEALSEDYRSVYPHPILTLPIPLSDSLYSDRNEEADCLATRYPLMDASRLRIGYLGDARAAKGFPLLAAAVRAVEEKRLAARFLIQCPRAASGDTQASPPDGLPDLQKLAAQPKFNLTLIGEKLSTAAYGELARQIDLILLPYLHDTYRAATSGIFAEAMALGTPVVTSSDTWMADEIRRSGAGVIFRRDRPSDFAGAVLEAVARHPELKARAVAASTPWRKFHNPGSLADRLLKDTQPTPD